MLILLYYLIGFILFGMAEKVCPKNMSGITWVIVLVIFTTCWPFWLAYGIGHYISSTKLCKRNEDEKDSESTE